MLTMQTPGIALLSPMRLFLESLALQASDSVVCPGINFHISHPWVGSLICCHQPAVKIKDDSSRQGEPRGFSPSQRRAVMMIRKGLAYAAAQIVILACMCLPAWAQFTSSIEGTVFDPTGAVIA